MSNQTKTFALFGNTYQQNKSANIKQVIQSIANIGARIIIEDEFAEFLKQTTNIDSCNFVQSKVSEISADFAVSIGGDGTFLKTAQQIGQHRIPIIGINTGRLGFISDLNPKDIELIFESVSNDNYQLEERTLLHGYVEGQELITNPVALNEIAVLKHDMSSMISIQAFVNGEYLTTYQSDGLVVSTPTGSTGYSLSVGGPILSPESKSIVISPIAAHSLSVRPFVLPDDVSIELKVQSRSHNYLVAIDGRSESLKDTTTIRIEKANHTIRIVRLKTHSFFDTLRNKLLWGADKR